MSPPWNAFMLVIVPASVSFRNANALSHVTGNMTNCFNGRDLVAAIVAYFVRDTVAVRLFARNSPMSVVCIRPDFFVKKILSGGERYKKTSTYTTRTATCVVCCGAEIKCSRGLVLN